MDILVGIDVGTTNVKCVAFNPSGEILAQSAAPTPVQSQPHGGAVYDAGELWGLVCGLLRSLQDTLPSSADIQGIAVTGMAEAGVPLDRAGEPLYPVISWFDPRTTPYASTWDTLLGPGRVTEITGLRCQHIFTANKLCWLRDHEKTLWKKLHRWHCIPDYISFCMTGQSAIDRSLATRTMLLDLHTGDWSEELLCAVGLSRKQLPVVVPSGTLIGNLTDEAARACCLKPGIPVCAGGHDHVCGALAAGVMSVELVLDSSGTSEEILTTSSNVQRVFSLGEKGFNVGWHTARGQFYLAGGLPASGASVDWYRKSFTGGSYTGSVPGANGVLFLPHIRGSSSPERNPDSRGAFLGIRDTSTPQDFMQAVYEGLAFEARNLMEDLTAGLTVEKVISIGGGTKNQFWLQIKADIFGVPIEVPAVSESTALGAALLAGIGCGLYPDEAAAWRSTYRPRQILLPREATRTLYDSRFSLFQELYHTLLPVSKIL